MLVFQRPDSAHKFVWPEAVTKYVKVLQRPNRSSAIHVTANHAHSGRVVRVIQNRIGQAGCWSWSGAGTLNKSFFKAPPVVFASARIIVALYVHLFISILTDVAQKHISSLRIEAGAERIAKTVGKNFLCNRR